MKFNQRLLSCLLMIGALLTITSGCANSPSSSNAGQVESDKASSGDYPAMIMVDDTLYDYKTVDSATEYEGYRANMTRNYDPKDVSDCPAAELFERMMESPGWSSNPGDYLRAHESEHEQLLAGGKSTLHYIFYEFLKGNQTGLKGHLMRLVLDELAPESMLDLSAYTGQQYFDEWLGFAKDLKDVHDDEWIKENYPAMWELLKMIDTNISITGYTSSCTDSIPSKDGETKFNISDYVPDYGSTSTRNADIFLDKLKRDGYHRGDEIDRNYNTDNITGIFNITPKGILENNPGLELFYVKDGYHVFLLFNGEIYRYDTFGGYHHCLALWDYDGNGIKDLVSFYNDGSGVSYLNVGITDLTTMKTQNIIRRGVLWEPGFTFDYDGEFIYIDGEKVEYVNGEFHCGTLF